jgi:hypothetical protein
MAAAQAFAAEEGLGDEGQQGAAGSLARRWRQ